MHEPQYDDFAPTRITVVDTAPMIGIYYSGPHQFAKLTATQTAATALVLKADDTDGATTTDLTVDVTSDTTYGEVFDAINAISTTHGWFAGLIGARRSDLVYNGATNVTWMAQAAIDCKHILIKLYDDTSIPAAGTQYVIPVGLTSFQVGINDSGKKIVLNDLSFQVSYTAANNKIQIIECDDVAKIDTVLKEFTAGNSGVELVKKQSDWGDKPLIGGKGKRMIVRLVNDNAISNPVIEVNSDTVYVEAGNPVGFWRSQV